jgi:cytochrome P450
LAEVNRDFLGTLVRTAREVGPLARIICGPPGWRETLYIVSSPELSEQVLMDPELFTKDEPGYREIHKIFGDTMLTSEGEAWVRHRRLLAPVFTRRRIASSYVSLFVEQIEPLVARWREAAATGAEVDVHPDMVGLASRTIGQILFGSEMAAAEHLRGAVDTINEGVLHRTVSAHPLPLAVPTPRNRRMAAALEQMRSMVAGLVAARAAHPDQGGEDMLSILLSPGGANPSDDAAGSRLDAEEVAAQVLTFWLAGHDTTATALTCTMLLLAQHPEWQERVAQEADRVLGGRAVTGADLPKLEWTDRVVRESMRLHPSSHSIGRSPARDTVLGGYRVPAGASIIVSPYALHRSPQVWDRPDDFDPGRFALPLNERARGGRYAWIPFGVGPHTCVGMQLALAEVTVAVATVCQQLTLTTKLETVPVEAALTLHPVGRLELTPHLRPRRPVDAPSTVLPASLH